MNENGGVHLILPSYKRLKLFTGLAHPELAFEIASHLGVGVSAMRVDRFRDGEIRVGIDETVRGVDCFLVQPTCPPVNENLMELLIIVDAMRRASTKTVTAVIPYYGYARQDRKAKARDPITAKLVANLLVTAGCDRILTVDLHAGQVQGFFDIPVDPLLGMPILINYVRESGLSNCVIASPDIGGTVRARAMAEKLGVGLVVIDKRRPRPNVSEVMNIIGDVKGKTVILVDDIIDTGGTIVQAAEALDSAGASQVFTACTHALLSGQAKDLLSSSVLKKIIVTNTIPISEDRRPERTEVLSVAPLLAEAIKRIYQDLPVSTLFG